MTDYQARRPWCLPCREGDGSRATATHRGVACEWHYGILTPAQQDELNRAIDTRHPKGGGARNVLEQIWIVRVELRQADRSIEETWRLDALELEADQVTYAGGREITATEIRRAAETMVGLR